MSDEAKPVHRPLPPLGGPPPLTPFGLILHHDARWSHEGHAIANDKLRCHFDRSVKFLPDEGEEGKYVVTLRHFRGEIVLEEAGFFVTSIDLELGRVALSDRSDDVLDIASLRSSPIDGALLCKVKHDIAPGGLDARFMHAAQAELLAAAEETEDGFAVRVGSELCRLPDLD